MNYTVVSAWGTEFSRHVLLLREDGARFRVTRHQGFFGPLVYRLVRDEHARESLDVRVEPYTGEYYAILRATRGLTGLQGEPIDSERSIDGTRISP